MNSYTRTPVNTVIFGVIFSILFGCLAFAGPAAINAIFAISVVGEYIAYSIPIVARYAFDNDFKPGPFSLGRWVR
jgi:amino acid transporter